MPLGCETVDLVQDAACLLCFSEKELLAAEAILREQIYADGAASTPRTFAELLAASKDWANLSQHQRQAIEVRQLCEDAVIRGARDDCDAATLKIDIACSCVGNSDLEAIISYLKCLQRQT